jgi:mono/diheme cytochrome c family protein
LNSQAKNKNYLRMKKNSKYIGFCGLALVLFASCSTSDPNSPGFEFFPDMYRPVSYEANNVNASFRDSMANRKPVEGTIARGYTPYPYKNDAEGYELAGVHLKNPFPSTPENIEKGKVLYGKFCVHCHGETGKGDGKVGAKLPGPPPPYDGPALKDLPEGKAFHTIHYGKGMMGSHAGQLTQEERWKIVSYVQTLQHPGGIAADTTKKAAVKEVAQKK